MSDLTADEALRAAEWFDTQYWTDAAMRLRGYAAQVDPAESVESLRAERDALAVALDAMRDERDSARQDADGWETSAYETEDQRDEARAQRDEALINARTWEDVREAEAIIARLRATHGDAARGRCARED